MNDPRTAEFARKLLPGQQPTQLMPGDTPQAMLDRVMLRGYPINEHELRLLYEAAKDNVKPDIEP